MNDNTLIAFGDKPNRSRQVWTVRVAHLTHSPTRGTVYTRHETIPVRSRNRVMACALVRKALAPGWAVLSPA